MEIVEKGFKMRTSDNKVILTYLDLQKLPQYPESPLLELHAGDLYMVLSPSTTHQSIALNLGRIFSIYLKIKDEGKIFLAPIDVLLNEQNTVVPDLVFIKKSNLEIVKEKYIKGIPDLIIEITSSNRDYDLVQKKSLYQSFKVPEYWIVDPENQEIIVFRIQNDTYSLYIQAKKGQDVSISPQNLSLELNLDEIFKT